MRSRYESRYEEAVYQILSEGPITPNEAARKLGISHKTAKDVLMSLAITRGDVRYRNSGRIHLFWRVKEVS